MIASLKGKLLDRDPKGLAVIEVNGLGYEVQVTLPTLASLGDIGDDAFLRIHTRVREDSITLFGFTTSEERRCFDALIATHGVGPSVALAILSIYSPNELRGVIANEDIDALSKVPGIGKKTANRLLVELKSKFDVALDSELVDISTTTKLATNNKLKPSAKADVATALGGLGYANDEIKSALNAIPDDGAAEDLLRLALKELAASA